MECFETVVGCQAKRYLLSLCAGVFTESISDWSPRFPDSRSFGM